MDGQGAAVLPSETAVCARVDRVRAALKSDRIVRNTEHRSKDELGHAIPTGGHEYTVTGGNPRNSDSVARYWGRQCTSRRAHREQRGVCANWYGRPFADRVRSGAMPPHVRRASPTGPRRRCTLKQAAPAAHVWSHRYIPSSAADMKHPGNTHWHLEFPDTDQLQDETADRSKHGLGHAIAIPTGELSNANMAHTAPSVNPEPMTQWRGTGPCHPTFGGRHQRDQDVSVPVDAHKEQLV
ncbi:hypothetical protein B0H16DRAFT_1711154 [Mycena metata]|uniref:Uncharacterized protein n=1 Tax=Mycena metata TaxID=1033252 RepID=A0AAD7NY14_9AGAR|nr:hypothetical protein B0H16DRAFT_1711154 [Mycena metata]